MPVGVVAPKSIEEAEQAIAIAREAESNPEIVKTSRGKVKGVEVCLSIPHYAGDVKRYESVVIKGLDRHGKPIRIKAKGWLARVFQHEIDHLDGRLYIDIAIRVWEAKPEDEESGEPNETAPDSSAPKSVESGFPIE